MKNSHQEGKQLGQIRQQLQNAHRHEFNEPEAFDFRQNEVW